MSTILLCSVNKTVTKPSETLRTRLINREESLYILEDFLVLLDPRYPERRFSKRVLGLANKRIPTISRPVIQWLSFFVIFEKCLKNQRLSFHAMAVLRSLEILNGLDLTNEARMNKKLVF